ncbi:MAG TPA: AraC family transcriptional regulator [Polyangia bacterium]|nr:AraC family transcriptional regulator [Polyangia bacterium]
MATRGAGPDAADSGGSVAVVAAKPALAALATRGLDVDGALRAAGLTSAAVSSFDNRLPFNAVRALWETAAEMTGDRWFGLHAGRDLPRGDYDLLDYILSASETVGSALQRIVVYSRLNFDRVNFRLVVEPRDARIVRRARITAPQYDEFVFALLLTRSRQNSGGDCSPRRVAFQHQRADDDGDPARVFGCPVRFGAPQDEMHFDPAVLDRPLRSADSKLMAVLVRYADTLMASIPVPDSVVGRVRASITRQAARALPTLPATAEALRVPERTLQRRLAAEGVRFSDLVDETRRALALNYLGNASLSVSDVGYLLHFSDPTAFHRAFRRWTGEAPRAYRRRVFGT